MNIWYAQMLNEAREILARFYKKAPANAVEGIIFKAARDIAKSIGDVLAEILDEMRGIKHVSAI